MVPLGQLTTKSILEDKIFEEIFEQEDEIYKARLILSLQDRAAELGVKAKFEEILKAYKRVDREMKRNRMKQPALLDNWTNFGYLQGMKAARAEIERGGRKNEK